MRMTKATARLIESESDSVVVEVTPTRVFTWGLK